MRGTKVRTYYLCSRTFTTPHALHRRRVTNAEDSPFEFSHTGRRLVYHDFEVRTQRDFLAWVDLRTGAYNRVFIPYDTAQVYARERAVEPAGGIAFATNVLDRAQLLWYAPPGGRARVLARLTTGDPRPGSLWVGRRLLHWRS